MRTMSRVGVLTFAALLAFAVTRSVAAEDFAVDKAIATAKSAADHEAIATYFDSEAAEAQAKVDGHSKMGEEYKHRGGVVIQKWHLDQHCDGFTKSYARAAKEAKALAAAHRAMAKEAK